MYYVLVLFVINCREVFINTFLGKRAAGGEEESNTIHVVLTLAIVATVAAISFVTDCLGIVLELNVRNI